MSPAEGWADLPEVTDSTSLAAALDGGQHVLGIADHAVDDPECCFARYGGGHECRNSYGQPIQPGQRCFASTSSEVAALIEARRALTPEQVEAQIDFADAADLCKHCRGSGEVELPPKLPDDDVELHSCPVCRPWPQGFPGLADGKGGWLIEPYGPRGTDDEANRRRLVAQMRKAQALATWLRTQVRPSAYYDHAAVAQALVHNDEFWRTAAMFAGINYATPPSPRTRVLTIGLLRGLPAGLLLGANGGRSVADDVPEGGEC